MFHSSVSEMLVLELWCEAREEGMISTKFSQVQWTFVVVGCPTAICIFNCVLIFFWRLSLFYLAVRGRQLHPGSQRADDLRWALGLCLSRNFKSRESDWGNGQKWLISTAMSVSPWTRVFQCPLFSCFLWFLGFWPIISGLQDLASSEYPIDQWSGPIHGMLVIT